MDLPHVVGQVGGTVTVWLTGEIDISNNDELRAVLFAAIRTPGIHAVEVDLHDVTFIDSMAIGSLIAGRREAVAKGYKFRVVRSQGIVRQILKFAGLEEFFEA